MSATPEAPVPVAPFDVDPWPDARRHALAVVMTVMDCKCGESFDGFTPEAAWDEFSRHMNEHDGGVVQ